MYLFSCTAVVCPRPIADIVTAELSASLMNPTCNDVIALIKRAATRAPRVFVAIDGRSGVGKSTFAAAIAAAMDASLIEGDAFYAGGVRLRHDGPEERAQACIDRPKLRGVLETLKSGRTAEYRSFDWDAFDGALRGLNSIVEAKRIIIVEGVYSCHPDLADLLDIRILLTAKRSVRQHRLLQREGSVGPWERQWHEAEDWYFKEVATPDYFDLVIG